MSEGKILDSRGLWRKPLWAEQLAACSGIGDLTGIREGMGWEAGQDPFVTGALQDRLL